MKLLNRTEERLILYFETCCVDQAGYVESQRMNEEDFEIAKRWHKEEYVKFHRLKIAEHRGAQDHVVRLNHDAWLDVQQLRRTRADRNCKPLEEFQLAGR